jgi:hypothetical protein
LFYAVSQKSFVDKNIYHHNARPHFTDANGYWPLEKFLEPMIYQTIPIAPSGLVSIFEVMIGMDEIEINDS